MNTQKGVSFIITPSVCLYKKRAECESPEQKAAEERAPSPEILPPRAPAPSLEGVAIIHDIQPPQLRLHLVVPDSPSPTNTIVDYDRSPLSPKTHRECARQRKEESAERKCAIEVALHQFCDMLTPKSQMSPTVVFCAEE